MHRRNISQSICITNYSTIMAQGASYWHTPSPKPYRWVTVPQLIDEWAEKIPDDEAYVVRMAGSPREAVTFLQLQQQTEALAAGLLQLGLRPGDFVIISGITCMNWILTDLACASIGVHTVCALSNVCPHSRRPQYNMLQKQHQSNLLSSW